MKGMYPGPRERRRDETHVSIEVSSLGAAIQSIRLAHIFEPITRGQDTFGSHPICWRAPLGLRGLMVYARNLGLLAKSLGVAP